MGGRNQSIEEEFNDENSKLFESQRISMFIMGYGSSLTPLERNIVWTILQFENSDYGFFGGNAYLANRVKCTTKTARELVSRLVTKGYLFRSNSEDGSRYLEVNRDLVLYGEPLMSHQRSVDEPSTPPLMSHQRTNNTSECSSTNISQRCDFPDSGEDSEESPSASSSSPKKKTGSSRARKKKAEESPSEEDSSSPDELDDSSYVGTSNSSGTRKKSQKRKTPSEKRSVASPPVEKKTRAAGEWLPGMKDTPKDEFPNTPAGKLAKKVEDHAAKIRGASRSVGKSARASAKHMEDCIERIGIDQLRILVDAWISYPNPREKYFPKPSSAKQFYEKLFQLIDWYTKYTNQTLEEAAAAARPPRKKKKSRFEGMDPELKSRVLDEIQWNIDGYRWRWWKFTEEEIKEIKSRGIEEKVISDEDLQDIIKIHGFDPSEEGAE